MKEEWEIHIRFSTGDFMSDWEDIVVGKNITFTGKWLEKGGSNDIFLEIEKSIYKLPFFWRKQKEFHWIHEDRIRIYRIFSCPAQEQ